MVLVVVVVVGGDNGGDDGGDKQICVTKMQVCTSLDSFREIRVALVAKITLLDAERLGDIVVTSKRACKREREREREREIHVCTNTHVHTSILKHIHAHSLCV